ncbi:MAG: hypothetical protein KKF89_00595 [Nanoarchaeota archaeon]|nr:hypothetical protein [Nanoarchaeota archaeon]
MNKKKFIRHKEKIIILTKGNICRTKKELLKTTIFKKILLLYLEFLRQKDSPLLGIIPEEYKNNKKKIQRKNTNPATIISGEEQLCCKSRKQRTRRILQGYIPIEPIRRRVIQLLEKLRTISYTIIRQR